MSARWSGGHQERPANGTDRARGGRGLCGRSRRMRCPSTWSPEWRRRPRHCASHRTRSARPMPYMIDGHNLVPHLGARLADPNDEAKLAATLAALLRRTHQQGAVYSMRRAREPAKRPHATWPCDSLPRPARPMMPSALTWRACVARRARLGGGRRQSGRAACSRARRRTLHELRGVCQRSRQPSSRPVEADGAASSGDLAIRALVQDPQPGDGRSSSISSYRPLCRYSPGRRPAFCSLCRCPGSSRGVAC